MKKLYSEYRDQGLEIVVVDGTSDSEEARKFIREQDLPYRFYESGPNRPNIVRESFGVRTYPTSYLVDREGRVLSAHVGFEEGDENEFEARIKALIEG